MVFFVCPCHGHAKHRLLTVSMALTHLRRYYVGSKDNRSGNLMKAFELLSQKGNPPNIPVQIQREEHGKYEI